MPQPRLTRPYGMAPAAFDALLRPCYRAHIHPHRIDQTIGDNPLSVGYYKRDGVLKTRGQKLDCTAAVDLGCTDLTPAQTERFMEELARYRFAAFHVIRANGSGYSRDLRAAPNESATARTGA